MFRMDPARLQEALEQLEQASRDHDDWRDQLVGMLLCPTPCDTASLGEDGHRHCRFGCWYYKNAFDELRKQPMFRTIETEHRRLHGIAAKLLRAAASDTPIDRSDYDELAAASARLRLELESLRQEIQVALSESDTLTGAYERGALLPELRKWRELARRGVQQCCIAFMDVDHFKSINDTHGHSAGDQVLAGAARCITEHLRPYDELFRYGGDEFLILLPGVDLEGGRRAIERIRRELAATPLFVDGEGKPVSVTASFGLVMLDPDEDVEESVDRGDTALLVAKSAGRNRVVSWDPSIATRRALPALRTKAVDGPAANAARASAGARSR